jgi:hypothetical protein
MVTGRDVVVAMVVGGRDWMCAKDRSWPRNAHRASATRHFFFWVIVNKPGGGLLRETTLDIGRQRNGITVNETDAP